MGSSRLQGCVVQGLAVACLLCLATSSVAQSVEWTDAVRQCWNDVASNTSLGCVLTEGRLRGRLSSKDCLVEAIKSARADDRETAVRWILACMCGTGGTQTKQAIRDRKDQAIRFVLETYGGLVP